MRLFDTVRGTAALLGIAGGLFFAWGTGYDVTATQDIRTWDCGEAPGTVTAEYGGTGVLYISGTGAMKNYSESNPAPWQAFRDSIGKVDIGWGITTIGDFAFYGCTDLQWVGHSVTSIGASAFKGCSGLRSINNILWDVKTIGASAFEGCTALDGIVISEGVTSIGDGAFYNCTDLASITCVNAVPPVIGINTFRGVDKSSVFIYVPESSVDAYKEADYWRDFTNIGSIPVPTARVIFDYQDGKVADSQIVAFGNVVAQPTVPVGNCVGDNLTNCVPDRIIEGWYRDAELSDAWNFDRNAVTSDITLYAKWASAASVQASVREIPTSVPTGGASVVAPLASVSNEITVGPNPVNRQFGSVRFFRSGSRIASASLSVYDAFGNVVKNIAIRDAVAVGNCGKRAVGSWDLRDASGRSVPWGTYLVRGTVKAFGGKTERVSAIVGVR